MDERVATVVDVGAAGRVVVGIEYIVSSIVAG